MVFVVCLGFYFLTFFLDQWPRTVPKHPLLLFLKNKKFFIYAKTIQQHQAKHPTGTVDTSQHHRDPRREGITNKRPTSSGRCGSTGFLWTTTAIFLCPLHPRYVKNKKKKWRERIYLYFCTEETHELRHYWCSVYTQTRCRASFWSFMQIPSSRDSDWKQEGGLFLFCFFKKTLFFNI